MGQSRFVLVLHFRRVRICGANLRGYLVTGSDELSKWYSVSSTAAKTSLFPSQETTHNF
jgi:hypothetical protein